MSKVVEFLVTAPHRRWLSFPAIGHEVTIWHMCHTRLHLNTA